MLRKKINILVLFLAITGIVLGIATYSIASDLELRSSLLIYLVYADIICLLVFFFIIIQKILSLWLERKKKGSRLHRQNILIFAFFAIIPSVIVLVVNYLFLNMTIEAWFFGPFRSSLRASEQVVNAYLEENSENLKLQIKSLQQIFRNQPKARENLNGFLNQYTNNNSLSELLIFDGEQNLLGKSYLTLALLFEEITYDEFEQIRISDEAIIKRSNDRLRGIARLDDNLFVYMGKILDPRIVSNIHIARMASHNLNALQLKKSDLQITVFLILTVVSLLLVLIAIWFGLNWSDRIMRPISELISAAEQIRHGNWRIRVEEIEDKTELNTLIRTFNMMLDRIYLKHREVEYEKLINETIIANISTGILCFDEHRSIHLANKRALDLLNSKFETLEGTKLDDVSLKFKIFFENFLKNPLQSSEKIILQTREKLISLQVHIAQQKDLQGRYILAFDDVTELLNIQKKASWTDIARRIAHEIRNPLTPIQLSAERLQKKYQKQIKEDQEIFNDCIEVIIRQVKTISNLVKQFSMLAKSSPPEFQVINIVMTCKKMLTFFMESHTNIQFKFIAPMKEVWILCDEQKIQQVLINLLKNAIEAIIDVRDNPEIYCTIQATKNKVALIIEDNGLGFPELIRDKLTEPYTTMKKDGTGLGLAIVAQIIEEHNGSLKFGHTELGGASVIVLLDQKDMEEQTLLGQKQTGEEVELLHQQDGVKSDRPQCSKTRARALEQKLVERHVT